MKKRAGAYIRRDLSCKRKRLFASFRDCKKYDRRMNKYWVGVGLGNKV